VLSPNLNLTKTYMKIRATVPKSSIVKKHYLCRHENI
jgi:hypothetical protein